MKSIWQPLGSRNLKLTVGNTFDVNGVTYTIGSIVKNGWDLEVYDTDTNLLLTVMDSGMGILVQTDQQLWIPMGARTFKFKVGYPYKSDEGVVYNVTSIVRNVDGDVDVFDGVTKLATFVPSGMSVIFYV